MFSSVVDGSNPASLALGFTMLFIPALIFMIYGIIDKRGVMFAVHALLLAFYVFALVVNPEDYLKSFNAALSNTRYLLSLMLDAAIAAVVCFFIIKLFFRRKS